MLVSVPRFRVVWFRTALDVVLPMFNCVVETLTFAPTFSANILAVPVVALPKFKLDVVT